MEHNSYTTYSEYLFDRLIDLFFGKVGKACYVKKVERSVLERHFTHIAKQVPFAPLLRRFRMYIRTIFDTPGFDAEFVELLEGQAIGATAVKQLVRRLRTPNGSNQINDIF